MSQQIDVYLLILFSPQWRHNERYDFSTHRRLDWLLNRLCVDQRKHQSSASLAFVRGIHRWTVDSPHKGQVTPVTRKMFPFDDVIMWFASDNHEGDTANNSACNLNNGLYKYRFTYACASCENNWLCYYVVSIAVPLFTYVGQIIYYRQKYGISGNTHI